MDKRCLEVADFTVLVHGLPPGEDNDDTQDDHDDVISSSRRYFSYLKHPASPSLLSLILPADATPEEVGEHFGRFGEVIEVQLICDMEPVLRDCKK